MSPEIINARYNAAVVLEANEPYIPIEQMIHAIAAKLEFERSDPAAVMYLRAAARRVEESKGKS